MRIKCRKCLLEEEGEEELLKALEELKSAIPEEERADRRLYEERLDFCRNCDSLQGGMCKICGCYVEFRALKKAQYCPDISKKW